MAPMAGAEIVDLADRRPRSLAEITAEEALDDILRLIGESSDPVGAAVALICGLARFAAIGGVTAEEITRLIETHIAWEHGPQRVQ